MLLTTAFFLCFFTSAAHAVSLIRDAEIEGLIKDYVEQVSLAAGIPVDQLQIYLVNDPTINAYVAGGTNIFIHTGLLLEAEHPDMVVGVLAHEIGHITGGHIVKRDDKARELTWQTGLTTLLSAGAALAGSSDLGMGILAGGQALSMDQLSRYSQAQEQAADQAGLSFLERRNISGEGLAELLTLLRQKERTNPLIEQAYIRTHPLTQERLSQVKYWVDRHPIKRWPESDPLVYRYKLARAKLQGFLLPPETTLDTYRNQHSDVARYARTIAYFRQSQLDRALDEMDGLIAASPSNPWFPELKGQMLFENGKIPEAVSAYENSHRLVPGEPLVTLALAAAYVRDGKAVQAIPMLEKVTKQEPKNLLAWRLLGEGYASQGNVAAAMLMHAEIAYLQERYQQARQLAEKAQQQLPANSPLVLRARDLTLFSEDALKDSK